MEKTEDAISEVMLGSSSIHGVGKIQIKNLLKKTMEDIRKFQKGHEEYRKQIKLLTSEKQNINQKLQILLKMLLDDEMARNVARRELAREKNVRNNRREYVEAKRNHKTEMKKARRKKESMKDSSRKKRKNLDKKKAKARVRVKARPKKTLSKRRKKSS